MSTQNVNLAQTITKQPLKKFLNWFGNSLTSVQWFDVGLELNFKGYPNLHVFIAQSTKVVFCTFWHFLLRWFMYISPNYHCYFCNGTKIYFLAPWKGYSVLLLILIYEAASWCINAFSKHIFVSIRVQRCYDDDDTLFLFCIEVLKRAGGFIC